MKIFLGRYNYALKLIPLMFANKNLIFLDESGFNLSIMKEYGWELSSKRLNLIKKDKSKNITLICAI